MSTIELDGKCRTDTDVRPYEINVANEHFETRQVRFDRTVVTGRDLIQALGYHPVEDYIVLRYRPDGALEEVGLEEKADLTEPHENSFFVNSATEMANLVIDGVRLTWTQAIIAGLTIKHLARKATEDIDILLERDDAEPRYIEDEEEIRLSRPGLERFHTKPAREVEIEVNNRGVRIRRGLRSGAEIKAAAIEQGVNIKPSFTLSEDLPSGSKLIGDKDKVRIKGGEHFLAIDDHDDS